MLELTCCWMGCRESEYAAWTLVNGYALNHTTVSVHRLGSLRNIEKLNDFLQENGIKLNSEGGILKGFPNLTCNLKTLYQRSFLSMWLGNGKVWCCLCFCWSVSPDGGLQQSSSVADTVTFTFAGGEVEQVPASYIEFAERLVLPIHGDLHSNQVGNFWKINFIVSAYRDVCRKADLEESPAVSWGDDLKF